MKRPGVWLSIIALGLICSATVAGAAGAADRVANVTGRWSGYFDSFGDRSGTRGVRGAFSIQISSQDGRRFAGEICFPPNPCAPVMGAVAASGEITMTGHSSDMQSIEVHGSPFDRSTGVVSTIVGNYNIMRSPGALEQGNVVAVHQLSSDGPAPDVAGMWGGQATPQGTAAARPVATILEVDRTGAITGRLGWVQPDAPSEIVGQAMRAGSADQVAIVGLLDDALLVASFVPSVSPRAAPDLDGSYELVSSARPHSIERGVIWQRYNDFRQTSRQSEAIANLRAMYTAEKAYYQEKDQYSTFIRDVGFMPERNNRYRYVLTADPISIQDRSTTAASSSYTDQGVDADVYKFPTLIYSKITSGPCVGTPVWGITETQQTTTFTGAAYGDIDGDSTLDIWTISTVTRTLSGSQCDAVGNVPAGEPANERNDLIK